jgi:hypothetical protein
MVDRQRSRLLSVILVGMNRGKPAPRKGVACLWWVYALYCCGFRGAERPKFAPTGANRPRQGASACRPLHLRRSCAWRVIAAAGGNGWLRAGRPSVCVRRIRGVCGRGRAAAPRGRVREGYERGFDSRGRDGRARRDSRRPNSIASSMAGPLSRTAFHGSRTARRYLASR